MRLISILLVFTLFIGCDDNGSNRRRRKPIDDGGKIVTPTPIEKNMPLGEAQRIQVSARASMFRELAANTRNGSIKTVWDVNKFCVEFDKNGRENYDAAFGRAMADALGRSAEGNLQSDVAEIFEGMAKQFENVLK